MTLTTWGRLHIIRDSPQPWPSQSDTQRTTRRAFPVNDIEIGDSGPDLGGLRARGVLSEDEFNAEAKILAS
ncbi:MULTISPECIES: SHOCT domain-containing protein [unclassified Rhodococcus (in: high G+C Gram-positive bacteria)]|uniref:SHOCT domain-containing protein n=1 Tax=unclassified Rhodococcus (in: high G+C Gram-positive bacteria) TaxID=192944 RepID=UPI0015CB2FC7|nr:MULTISPECIES: SHOCT domain-containing protein [unclassified Rhodococcus (in: high G+C Gram-positive bacteria)]